MPETRAPWHHWPIAVLALIFYLIGTLDFIFTWLDLGFYVGRFSPDQRNYFDGLPFWIEVVWAIGTIGGLFGAWLLLRRNRFAVLILFAAFAALIFLTVWPWFFLRPSSLDVMGFLGLYLMVTTCALSFLFYVYARWERTEKALD